MVAQEVRDAVRWSRHQNAQSGSIPQRNDLEVIIGTRNCMVATIQHLVAILCHDAGNNVRSTQFEV
jgi:hypothetical protein